MYIQIECNGMQYTLDAPPKVCRRIQTDKCFASRYFDAVLKIRGQDKPCKRDANGNTKEINIGLHSNPSTSAEAPTTAPALPIVPPSKSSTPTQAPTPPNILSIASTSLGMES